MIRRRPPPVTVANPQRPRRPRTADGDNAAPMNTGLLYAALAFVTWGLYPLYLLMIASVSPIEIVLQRSVWSLVFVLGLLALLRRWAWLPVLARQPRRLGSGGAPGGGGGGGGRGGGGGPGPRAGWGCLRSARCC